MALVTCTDVPVLVPVAAQGRVLTHLPHSSTTARASMLRHAGATARRYASSGGGGRRTALSRVGAARAVAVFCGGNTPLRRVQGHARASHGFREESTEQLPDLDSQARLFVHDSGARLLSLSAPRDVNKTFAIAFRTASEDSTGVAHILEHSVLCGSARYPVREPFVDMLRGSLQTFLNAMTYPDRTVYPVSSPNRQDFYNLASVYLDAVLAPRLEEATFRQEGWHWALNDADGPLKRQGVVLSEMRGVYSSPDATHYRESRRRLFSDMVYSHDSGGDPARITDLSYRAFLDFHQDRYHPSNALIVMHGDDPEEDRLRFLDSRLAPFAAGGPHAPTDRNADHGLRTQPQWSAPQRAVAPSPASAGSGDSYHSALHWVAGFDPAEELEASLARDVLGYCLMGTHAAPLRHALQSSGLGQEVTGGLSSGLLQPTFSAGLKGVAESDVDAVPEVALDAIHRVATEGVDARTVEAAVHAIEFSMRELNTGSLPRGVALALSCVGSWTYGRDVLESLRIDDVLRTLRSSMLDASGSGAPGSERVAGLAASLLRDNPHRLHMVLEPDTGLLARREEEEAAAAAAQLERLSPEERNRLVADTEALRQHQSRKDSEEALATVPELAVSDLPRSVPSPEHTLQEMQFAGEPGACLTVPGTTQGITYFDLSLDASSLPQPLMPLVPVFQRTLMRLGTRSRSLERLSQDADLLTGGITSSRLTGLRDVEDEDAFRCAALDVGPAAHRVTFRTKALSHNAAAAADLLRDVITDGHLDQQERVCDLLKEMRSKCEASAVSAGHSLAASWLESRFDEAACARDHMGGLAFYRQLCAYEEEARENWPTFLAKLATVRDHLVHRRRAMLTVTAQDGDLDGATRVARDLAEALPAASPGFDDTSIARLSGASLPPRSNALGISVSSSVQYVARTASLGVVGYEAGGAAAVACRLLRTGWLWEQLRVLGGAYGAGASLNRRSGLLTFTSYRDPNVESSFRAYANAPSFLWRVAREEPRLLEQAIIGTIGDIDRPMEGHATAVDLANSALLGVSGAARAQRREEVLETTPADVEAFADALDAALARPEAQHDQAVVGPEAALRTAAAECVPSMRIEPFSQNA